METEMLFPKQRVAGSSPVSRSLGNFPLFIRDFDFFRGCENCGKPPFDSPKQRLHYSRFSDPSQCLLWVGNCNVRTICLTRRWRNLSPFTRANA